MDLESLRDKFEGKELARWMTKKEVDILVQRIYDIDPYKVFESGTANGYSSSYIASTGHTVITFDPANRRKIWSYLPKEVQNRIVYNNEPFKNAKKYLDDIQSSEYLYFFIDGDHSREGIKEDFETIKPYLQEGGGRVMFHDYPNEYLMSKYIDKYILPLAKSHTLFSTKRGMIEMVF